MKQVLITIENKHHLETKLINADGHTFTYNPSGKNEDLEEPTMENYGWQSSNSFEEESGWIYEGGEDAYYEALKKWKTTKT